MRERGLEEVKIEIKEKKKKLLVIETGGARLKMSKNYLKKKKTNRPERGNTEKDKNTEREGENICDIFFQLRDSL